MTFETTYVVQYEGRIHSPDGSPSTSGGAPDGQGPPEDAAPSDVVANVLSKTPDRVDTRLFGVGTDDQGNPQGGPPREYRVRDVIDDSGQDATGHRVVRGVLPAASQADADAIFDDVAADLAGADEHALRVVQTPLGAVTTDDVQAWYEAHPDQQPVDDNGDPYIPTTWDPERHVEREDTA